MTRCRLDKIASVTRRLRLPRNAVLGPEIPAEEGVVVAGRILDAKERYCHLEDVHGRLVPLHPGDVIAGVLGHRDALYGYSGHVPAAVRPGDVLQLLNLGGVLGTGATEAPGLGAPFRVEVLGTVLDFPHPGRRRGVPARIQDAALPPHPLPAGLPPVVALVGTCMDAGKTTAATALIREWTRAGLRVAAGKLTGVSLRRDVLAMADAGAGPALSFTDFGVVTTTEANAVPAARALLAWLAEADPDVVVLEMGDGLLGRYGVQAILDDPPLRGALAAILLCAQDPVGAWGGVQLLAARGLELPLAVTGRVTDNPPGCRYCTGELDLPAANALRQPAELAALVRGLAFQGPREEAAA